MITDEQLHLDVNDFFELCFRTPSVGKKMRFLLPNSVPWTSGSDREFSDPCPPSKVYHARRLRMFYYLLNEYRNTRHINGFQPLDDKPEHVLQKSEYRRRLLSLHEFANFKTPGLLHGTSADEAIATEHMKMIFSRNSDYADRSFSLRKVYGSLFEIILSPYPDVTEERQLIRGTDRGFWPRAVAVTNGKAFYRKAGATRSYYTIGDGFMILLYQAYTPIPMSDEAFIQCLRRDLSFDAAGWRRGLIDDFLKTPPIGPVLPLITQSSIDDAAFLPCFRPGSGSRYNHDYEVSLALPLPTHKISLPSNALSKSKEHAEYLRIQESDTVRRPVLARERVREILPDASACQPAADVDPNKSFGDIGQRSFPRLRLRRSAPDA